MEMNENVKSLTSNLIDFARKNICEDAYSLFIPFIGEECQDRPVMFVGRDTRGNEDIIKSFSEPNCYRTKELDWLNKGGGYSYTRSPFWRVILRAVSGFYGAPYGYDVHRRICWSNLFRVSPCKRKKTPDKIKKLQFDVCASLLLEEFKQIRPMAVVFLTGEQINPFYKYWNAKMAADGMVSLYCVNVKSFNFHIDGDCSIPALVCDHPQNKTFATEDETICRVNAFLRKPHKYGVELECEGKYYKRHLILREMLNARDEGIWKIYRSNDLTISEQVCGYRIGIESAFFDNKFSFCLTSWETSAKTFLLGPLYDQVLQSLGEVLGGEKRIRGKRADILFNPIGISWDKAREAIENETILAAMHKVHSFLLEQSGV